MLVRTVARSGRQCPAYKRVISLVGAAWAVVVSIPSAHAAPNCSDALSTAVASALRPIVSNIDACKDLKRQVNAPFPVTIGIDKTDKVELRALQYCPTDTTSRLTATIYVKCRTSDAAVFQLAVDETLDAEMNIRNADCAVIDFKIEPRGEIGRLVAGIIGLSDLMKKAASAQIATLCK